MAGERVFERQDENEQVLKNLISQLNELYPLPDGFQALIETSKARDTEYKLRSAKFFSFKRC